MMITNGGLSAMSRQNIAFSGAGKEPILFSQQGCAHEGLLY